MLSVGSFNPVVAACDYLNKKNLRNTRFDSISLIFDEMLINNYAREPLLFWMFQNKYRESETAVKSLWLNFDPSTNTDVEGGASLMACCQMLGIADCAEIAKNLYINNFSRSISSGPNMTFLVRTLQYIGTSDSIPMLVRGLGTKPSNWIFSAIMSIGIRNYDGYSTLALGGGGDIVNYLSAFIRLELFKTIECRQDLVPFLLKEADCLIDLLDHEELHIRVLALEALISILHNMAMRKLLYDKINSKLNSWRCRNVEPSEDFVLGIFTMCKKPE